MKPYKTVRQSSETEYIINRSRFIGRCFPAESEEAALAVLGDIRKKHWDATHNCFAYRTGSGAARFSDDGEPGGTAGKPIMDVLLARDLTDVLCVVTRYFGGVLLGAGGLVRAYSRSASDAVSAAGVVCCVPGAVVQIPMDYSRYGALEGFIRANAEVRDVSFGEGVVVSAAVESALLDRFKKDIVERSDGRCAVAVVGEGYIRKGENQ